MQRILWREDPSDSIVTYELLTLIYGTASALFVATKVIQRLAELETHLCPKGSLEARKDFYVDDLLTDANSKTKIIEIQDQLIASLNRGEFKIRKWASNSSDILQDLANLSSKGQLLELDKDGLAKTLGINWNTAKDLLQYRISTEFFK